MKRVRIAIIGFILVLTVVFFFYVENKTINQLKNGQLYPMVEEPKNHPLPLTISSAKVPDTGLNITKLYTLQDQQSLYFGMWYGQEDSFLNGDDDRWKREDGVVQFLVKVVDSNGSTYNGKTVGKQEGTFSTFQYVQFDDYKLDEDSEELEVYFYPLKEGENGEEPSQTPTAQVNVELR